MLLNQKPLFNPNCDDNINTRRIIGGETSNIVDLSNIKYRWAYSIYQSIIDSFWRPELIDLVNDKNHYNDLSRQEQEVFDTIFSYLFFLDSIQINNIPTNFIGYITAPEINLLLTAHAAYEGIHVVSYKMILETVIPKEKRDGVVHKYRTYTPLLDRNKEITSYYQCFQDNRTVDNLVMAFVANFLLESLYFYNGFLYFYNLSTKGLFPGVVDIIRLINKDEAMHISTFVKILKALDEELPYSIMPMVREMMEEAALNEIRFNNIMYGNSVPGISDEGTTMYTKQLANKRCAALGIEPIFPDCTFNPYKHLDRVSNLNNEVPTRGNYFEATAEYGNAGSIEDDL